MFFCFWLAVSAKMVRLEMAGAATKHSSVKSLGWIPGEDSRKKWKVPWPCLVTPFKVFFLLNPGAKSWLGMLKLNWNIPFTLDLFHQMYTMNSDEILWLLCGWEGAKLWCSIYYITILLNYCSIYYRYYIYTNHCLFLAFHRFRLLITSDGLWSFHGFCAKV